MRFRWSDGRGAAVEFAADAAGLARAAADAAIDFRRKTARREGGEGGKSGGAFYPAADLHVDIGIAWGVPTDVALGPRKPPAGPGDCRPGTRGDPDSGAKPGLPARLVLAEVPCPGPSDVEICRDSADRWWSMSMTARRNAQMLVWLFGDVRRMIELALAAQRAMDLHRATRWRAGNRVAAEHAEG